MILFDNRTKIKWEWDNLIKTRIKEIQSLITSKANIKKSTENKYQFKKKKQKNLTQVSMPNLQASSETGITPHGRKWIKQWRSTLKQTKWGKTKLKQNISI